MFWENVFGAFESSSTSLLNNFALGVLFMFEFNVFFFLGGGFFYCHFRSWHGQCNNSRKGTFHIWIVPQKD